MATQVYETSEITLLNGETISMRPLKISLLRKFMKKFDAISDVATDNDASMDVLIECVQIAMEQYKPELATDKEALEDILDLPSVYRVIEAASGIKFDDQGNVKAAGILG